MSPTFAAPRVLSWASDIEPDTLEQAARSARLPCVSGHVALMPDAHFGYGATVGSVIPTSRAIIPYAVGVDIGCGMAAVETNLRADQLPDDLGRLHGEIRRSVPTGRYGHKDPDPVKALGELGLPSAISRGGRTDRKAETKIREQFGSLGGGNHFIEICLDERDTVWVVLHSGSRWIGKHLADVHHATAKGLMAKWFIELEDPNLAYLVEDTPEFDAYVADMLWAQRYAWENRARMLDLVLAQFKRVVPTLVAEDKIMCHHNFAEKEHHGGRDLWITRKGAIRARVGDRGIIPGSMATGTYIVRGLDGTGSYSSCSHGAGRRLGRKAARRELTVESLNAAMDGIAWNDSDAEAILDEHPEAYKDVKAVMADQADLVEITHTLRQVLNVKGA